MSEHGVAELLPFYANGTLDEGDRARVETELATCASCAAELRELQSLASSLRARAGAAPPPPEHVFETAAARITASSTFSALHASWWSAPARYATAAVLVVGVGAVAAAAYHEHAVEMDAQRLTYVGSTLPRQTQVAYDRPGGASAPKRKVNAAAPLAAVPAPAGAPEHATATRTQHRLAKSAQLALLVRDVESTLKSAQSTIRDAGGDVTALSDTTPPNAGALHDATLSAEVPAERLDAAMDRLAALGAVQNRTINAEDVDDAIVDEEARLRNLRREESDLRNLMDKGGKVGDILDVQQHLSDVRGEIEQLAAQHEHDVHRVATSTIALALTEDRPNATPAKPGPTARIDGAWHAGLDALGDAITAVLATVAWCVAIAPLPIGLAAIGYAGMRFVKRRARIA